MDRRALLKAIGATVGAVGVTGCTGEGGLSPPTRTPRPTPTPTPNGASGEQTPTAGAGTGAQTETTTTTEPRPTTVKMVSGSDGGTAYYFDPIGLFVEPGTTLTFENESGSHSSTAYVEGTGSSSVTRIPADAEGWDSGILSQSGATFEHTFEVEGTYDYFCVPHKTLGMVGRIVVGSPGGPAEGSMPPDGKVPTSEAIVNQGAISYSEFQG